MTMAALVALAWPAAEAPAQADQAAPAEMVPLPYPDRISALIAPVNVRLRYAPTETRDFQTEIIWGPEKAPGLYAMRTSGSVSLATGDGGLIAEMSRTPTAVAFGPRTHARDDGGRITATVTPTGSFRFFELRLAGLDTAAHRAQFAILGAGLIDTGRVPPFKRASTRTGPGDTGGNAAREQEKDARAELLEALQPMLGMIFELPAEGVSTGTRLVVIRRDLGDLFRAAQPIPFRVEGEVVGVADIDGRRFLAVKLDRAKVEAPMRANISGYALIDLATGLPEAVVAEIELVVLHGTDASVFRFVDRRVLTPLAAPPR